MIEREDTWFKRAPSQRREANWKAAILRQMTLLTIHSRTEGAISKSKGSQTLASRSRTWLPAPKCEHQGMHKLLQGPQG